MSEAIQTQEKTEIQVVNTQEVACDGPTFSKHPRVYLTMVDDENGNPQAVACPYCSKTFKFQYAP